MKKKSKTKHGQHKHSGGKCVHEGGAHKMHASRHHK
jgi:hypothetical protein